MITGEQDDIGNKEVLGLQWFGVQGDYAEELASGMTTSPTPCTKVRKSASTVHATNPLKADDGAGYRTLARPHGRATTQMDQARTSPSKRIEGIEHHQTIMKLHLESYHK